MVQRKINNSLVDLACQFSQKELIDVIGDYLREKRKKKIQDKFMTPQTYVCYRAIKDKRKEEEVNVSDQNPILVPEEPGDIPPYMRNLSIFDDEYWENVAHIIKPTKNAEDHAYNRHN